MTKRPSVRDPLVTDPNAQSAITRPCMYFTAEEIAEAKKHSQQRPRYRRAPKDPNHPVNQPLVADPNAQSAITRESLHLTADQIAEVMKSRRRNGSMKNSDAP